MMKTVITFVGVVLFICVFHSCNTSNTRNADGAMGDSLTTAVKQNARKAMQVDTVGNLIVYTPAFDSVDLVCGKMPAIADPSVLMMCEAAFTGQLLDKFDHRNIAGNHVSGGKLYRGYSCKANTGCFAWHADSREWKFAVGDCKRLLADAERHGGMAFGQSMVVFNHKVQDKHPMKNVNSRNEYRVLAEYNDKLCIIDGKGVMSFKDFVQALADARVKHALYLDMGSGWNFSWYKDDEGRVHYIHKARTRYATNWIVFYR